MSVWTLSWPTAEVMEPRDCIAQQRRHSVLGKTVAEIQCKWRINECVADISRVNVLSMSHVHVRVSSLSPPDFHSGSEFTLHERFPQ